MTNPYAPDDPNDPRILKSNRTMTTLAAVGAWAAAVYWGLLTLLLFFGSLGPKGTSPLQMILPVLLVYFYSVRGMSAYKGDYRALDRLLALHAVGGVVAILQMFSASPLVVALHAVKLLIHLFGGTVTFLAKRSFGR